MITIRRQSGQSDYAAGHNAKNTKDKGTPKKGKLGLTERKRGWNRQRKSKATYLTSRCDLDDLPCVGHRIEE